MPRPSCRPLQGKDTGQPAGLAPNLLQWRFNRAKDNEMNQSTKDRIEGAIHEAKGKVKETAGQVLNKPDLEIEGKTEDFGGKVQKKVGQIEQVFEK